MKQLLIVILVCLLTVALIGNVSSQTSSYYGRWDKMQTAKLTGGEHGLIRYSGSVIVPGGGDAYTSWFPLGQGTLSDSTTQDLLYSFDPRDWTLINSLDAVGAGDSVGLGTILWELSFDTLTAIWYEDSANIINGGLGKEPVGGNLDTTSYAIPLCIPLQLYCRLKVWSAAIADTVEWNWDMVGRY